MPASPANKYLTTSQAAKICNVTRFTILNWIKSGKLLAVSTLGGHQRIPKETVLFLLKKKNSPVEEELPSSNINPPTVRCWESKEITSSGQHACSKCLVFKEKIGRCFLVVKRFGTEKVQCNFDCADCKYLAKYYPQRKKVLRKMEQEAAAKSSRSNVSANNDKINEFLQKTFYLSGKHLALTTKTLMKIFTTEKIALDKERRK